MLESLLLTPALRLICLHARQLPLRFGQLVLELLLLLLEVLCVLLVLSAGSVCSFNAVMTP